MLPNNIFEFFSILLSEVWPDIESNVPIRFYQVWKFKGKESKSQIHFCIDFFESKLNIYYAKNMTLIYKSNRNFDFIFSENY